MPPWGHGPETPVPEWRERLVVGDYSKTVVVMVSITHWL
jgi:hypothetical protein